jgi:hypothetical protein
LVIKLTATLLTHAFTPAQLPEEGGGVPLVEVWELLVVGVVCVVVGGAVVGALAPPCNADLTAASKRPLAIHNRKRPC